MHPAALGFACELRDSGSDPAPHCSPVVVAGGHELVSWGGAFVECLVAVALEHKLRRPPNVDLRDRALKLHIYTSTVNECLRPEIAGPASVSRGWRMAPILTPENVVRRIAAECTFVDEYGAVGIRLEPAAAIVRQYGNQFRGPQQKRQPRPPKPPPLL
jgi:hypothetical protein